MDNFSEFELSSDRGRPDHEAALSATPLEWGPKRPLKWWTLAAAVGALAWLAFDVNAEDRVVAAVLTVAFALVTAVLVRIRVRLRVDDDGVVISGMTSYRRFPFSQVRRIATPTRGRFGRRTASLEIEIAVLPRDTDTAVNVDNPVDNSVDGIVDNSGARPFSADAATDRDAPSRRDPGAAPSETELVIFGLFDLGEDPATVGRSLRHRWLG